MRNSNFILFLVIIFFISKEWIIINEEFLIICSFFAVFFFLISNLQDMLTIELNNRSISLKNQFMNFFLFKRSNIKLYVEIILYKFFLFVDFYYFFYFLIQEIIIIFKNKYKKNTFDINLYVKNLLNSYIIKINYEYLNLYLNIIKASFNAQNKSLLRDILLYKKYKLNLKKGSKVKISKQKKFLLQNYYQAKKEYIDIHRYGFNNNTKYHFRFINSVENIRNDYSYFESFILKRNE